MLVELDTYELANLLGLLRRNKDKDNGEWFMQITWKTMEALGKGEEAVKRKRTYYTNNFMDKVPLVGKWNEFSVWWG